MEIKRKTFLKMKYKALKYSFSEGLNNIKRNKMMCIMAIGTICIFLLIFGLFVILSQNINFNLENIKNLPDLEIFLNSGASEEEIEVVENLLKDNKLIQNYIKVSKRDNFEKYIESFKDKPYMYEGFDENIMSVSFIIKPHDIEEINILAESFKNESLVENTVYAGDAVKMIIKLSNGINTAIVVIISFMVIVCVIVVSNTIRMAMESRKKEISIMKLIGATDSFITWPFIFEGLMLGFIGGIIAFAGVITVYGAVSSFMENNLTESGLWFIKFVDMTKAGILTAFLNILIGSVIGGTGSFFTVKRHINA